MPQKQPWVDLAKGQIKGRETEGITYEKVKTILGQSDFKEFFDTGKVDSDNNPINTDQFSSFRDAGIDYLSCRLYNKGLSDETLIIIALRIIAHLIVTETELRPKHQEFGDAAITYQGKTGICLTATHYGQNAMDLDPTGILARSGMKKATIFLAT